MQVTAVACPRNHEDPTITAIRLDRSFLCPEQLVDLLPVITRRVQPVGKRPVQFDGEFDVKLVADIPNARRVLKRAKTATWSLRNWQASPE